MTMGRPPISLTEEQIAQVEDLASRLTLEQLADHFRVSRATFRAILARDEEVSSLYKRGRAKTIAAVGQNLIQKALNGDTTSMIFFLKTQAGWRETNALELTGKGGEPLQVPTITSTMTAQEAAEAYARMRENKG